MTDLYVNIYSADVYTWQGDSYFWRPKPNKQIMKRSENSSAISIIQGQSYWNDLESVCLWYSVSQHLKPGGSLLSTRVQTSDLGLPPALTSIVYIALPPRDNWSLSTPKDYVD